MKSTTPLSKNLKKLMKAYDINSSELARRTGIGQPVINRIMHGLTSNPGVATLKPIASFFALSMDELIGEMYSNDLLPLRKDVQQIPLISWVDAANWPKASILEKKHKKIAISKAATPITFALLIETEMDSRFPSGTVLVVEPTTKPKNRDYVIVQLATHQNTALKHYILDGDTIYLKPIDTQLDTIKFSKKHRIVGVVVQSIFNFD